MIRMTSVVCVLAALMLGVRLSAHDGPHESPTERAFKVGKSDEVKIGESFKAGSVLVLKGKYLLAHRIDGDRHVVVLTSVDKGERNGTVAYEIPTTVLPARRMAKTSRLVADLLEDNILHLRIVEIVGEDLDHLPLNTDAGVLAAR